jgi:hypothetical protein
MLDRFLATLTLMFALVPFGPVSALGAPDPVTCCEKHLDCCHRDLACCGRTPKPRSCCKVGGACCKWTSPCCRNR